MKIIQLMSSNIVSVAMDDQLSKVKTLLEETGFHHLLVIEKNRLVGVISDRDLYKAINPKIDTPAATIKDLACLNKKAHQIMSSHPITLGENATVKQAVTVFNAHVISCIPIVNSTGKPVGIISWRDIMKALGQTREK